MCSYVDTRDISCLYIKIYYIHGNRRTKTNELHMHASSICNSFGSMSAQYKQEHANRRGRPLSVFMYDVYNVYFYNLMFHGSQFPLKRPSYGAKGAVVISDQLNIVYDRNINTLFHYNTILMQYVFQFKLVDGTCFKSCFIHICTK